MDATQLTPDEWDALAERQAKEVERIAAGLSRRFGRFDATEATPEDYRRERALHAEIQGVRLARLREAVLRLAEFEDCRDSLEVTT